MSPERPSARPSTASLPSPPSAPRPVALRTQDLGAPRDEMRNEVLAGLRRRRRELPSKYFYDATGSELFELISRLPEYYLTRTERSLLEAHGDRIAAALPPSRCTVVDLGAGDGHKTRMLLERVAARGLDVTYAPVDVSIAALDGVARDLGDALPWLAIEPLAGEYTSALRWLGGARRQGSLLVLFLGSSIGNMTRPESRRFLRTLARALRPDDHLLVGFDLVKDPSLLVRAYDDAAGVTARFNLNLLERLNRELGADFALDGFRHRARWAARSATMESHLVSTRAQRVTIAGERFEFARGSSIRTEISVKYRDADLEDFGRAAGLVEVARLHDEQRWFADVLWRRGDDRPRARR